MAVAVHQRADCTYVRATYFTAEEHKISWCEPPLGVLPIRHPNISRTIRYQKELPAPRAQHCIGVAAAGCKQHMAAPSLASLRAVRRVASGGTGVVVVVLPFNDTKGLAPCRACAGEHALLC